MRAASTSTVRGHVPPRAMWRKLSGWLVASRRVQVGGSAHDPSVAWCAAHNVPEDECIECHPDLAPPLKDLGWCATHGVAQCPFEHPEVAQLKQTPSIDPEMLARAARALALRPRSENNSRCGLHLRRVHLIVAYLTAFYIVVAIVPWTMLFLGM